MTKKVYLVIECVKSRQDLDSGKNEVIFASENKNKAKEALDKRASALCEDYGLEDNLFDYVGEEWEVSVNENSVYAYDPTDYEEGFEIWIKEIELDKVTF